MHRRQRNRTYSCALIIGLFLSVVNAAWAYPTAFTYQGKLSDAGNPATGSYDMEFKLFDSPTVGAGSQYATSVQVAGVAATAGNFTVALDFGNPFFVDLYLEIGVRPAGSPDAYTILAPRQTITASPYSLQTLMAANAQSLNGLPASRYLASDSSGNVGVGVNPPVNGKLQVNGGTYSGVYSESNSGSGVYGESNLSYGVHGKSSATDGVRGESTASDPIAGVGVHGLSHGSVTGVGVKGESDFGMGGLFLSTSGYAVYGSSSNYIGVNGSSFAAAGVRGISTQDDGVYGTSSSGFGVHGKSDNSVAVLGESINNNGVSGFSQTASAVRGVSGAGSGVRGESSAASTTAGGVIGIGLGIGSIGVIGNAGSGTGVGVFGVSTSATGFGIYARNNTAGGKALLVDGDAHVAGTLTKLAGSFKIDHPLDPANKYLSHSFVESPDMKNIYDGNVTTDANGSAIVTLPDWFEALNKDFRYQLTVIGTFAQAIIAEKVRDNRFAIATSVPHVEVSWQVTGIRRDAYADLHRIPVEEPKPQELQGSYLHPAAFGRPDEDGEGRRIRP